MATRGVVGSSTPLSNEEAIDWAMGELTFASGWDATPPPPDWVNDLSAIKRCVATLLVGLETGDAGRPSLKRAFADGYRVGEITKGFHQREELISFVLHKTVMICHLTVQLQKSRNNYKTIHIYVTAAGEFAGATLWDVARGRPIS
jgi:hypothetical protein